MRTIRKAIFITAGMGLMFLALQNNNTFAQETRLPTRIMIQATAMGQSTQLGRMFSVNIHITESLNSRGSEGTAERV